MKIFAKLVTASLATAAISAVVGYIGFDGMNKAKANLTSITQDALPSSTGSAELRTAVGDIMANLLRLPLASDNDRPHIEERIEKDLAHSEKLTKQLQKSAFVSKAAGKAVADNKASFLTAMDNYRKSIATERKALTDFSNLSSNINGLLTSLSRSLASQAGEDATNKKANDSLGKFRIAVQEQSAAVTALLLNTDISEVEVV